MAKCEKCEKSFGIFELKNKVCKNCIEKETPACWSCKKRFESNLIIEGYCHVCYKDKKEVIEERKKLEKKGLELLEKSKQEEIALKKQKEQKELDIKNIILTTESHIDLKIEKRVNIISAECAFGMNLFKDLFIGVRDIVGGRSNSLQKTLRESKNIVLTELRKEAYAIGANAVIGVDLDYSEFSGTGKSMLFIVASGTAVILK